MSEIHLMTWCLRNGRNGHGKKTTTTTTKSCLWKYLISDRIGIHRISSAQLLNNASNRARVTYTARIKASDNEMVESGLSRNKDVPVAGLGV